MDPRQIISELLSGERSNFVDQGEHESLIVSEQAICEGHKELSEQLCE